MRTAQRNVRKAGRPPAGINGDKVADYPQVSMRVPPKVRDMLAAVAAVKNQPHWRILMDALALFVVNLSPEDRQAVEALSSR
jgi:hypothetical protein